MSTKDATPKRPESFDDLPSWWKTDSLAAISFSEPAVRAGVLAAAQELLRVFDHAYGADVITIEIGGSLLLSRPRSEEELADRLASEQRRWDQRYGSGA